MLSTVYTMLQRQRKAKGYQGKINRYLLSHTSFAALKASLSQLWSVIDIAENFTAINLFFSFCCLFVTSSITHRLAANYICNSTPFVNGIWFMMWQSFDLYLRQAKFEILHNENLQLRKLPNKVTWSEPRLSNDKYLTVCSASWHRNDPIKRCP